MNNLDPSKIKAVILDMDGVLWRDTQPLGNLPDIFYRLNQLDWKYSLATNNATRTVDEYRDKLYEFGVSLESFQIVNSSQAAVYFLQRSYPNGGNVFVVGEDSLIKDLSNAGYTNSEQNTLAVVVGMDRKVTYEKLRVATLLIRSGVPFIATNPDKTFPTPNGLVPGTGATLAALEAATGVSPVIVGKPSPEMYQVALEKMEVSPEETLVIGDRLETDILGAQNLGCQTALVLSGVTNQRSAQEWIPSPDWIGKDLTSLLSSL